MIKVAIIPGHHPHDQGANGHDFTEWSYNYELSKMIMSHLEDCSCLEAKLIKRPSPNYGISMQEIQGKVINFDLCLELHCNSAHANAKGREIWVHSKTSETNIEIAQIILFKLGKIFKNRSRGIKKAKKGDRGYKFLNLIGPMCQIIEPGFLSNKKESKLLLEKADDYALGLSEVLKEVAGVWRK